jgi:hypothetical protein
MTNFFIHVQEMMRREGMDEDAFKQFFGGIRGVIILDTLENAAELKSKVNQLDTGLPILETKSVGCDNVKNVIQEAIERKEKRQKQKPSV